LATTTATACAGTSTKTTTALPNFLRPRLIDGQGTSTKLMAVELRHRLLRLLVGRHFDECESPRSTGHTIAHDGDGLYLPGLSEQCFEILFHRLIRKIPDEQFATHVPLLRQRVTRHAQ
jgi:hypothetical protein